MKKSKNSLYSLKDNRCTHSNSPPPVAIIDRIQGKVSVGGSHINYRNSRLQGLSLKREGSKLLINRQIKICNGIAHVGCSKREDEKISFCSLNGFTILRSLFGLPEPKVKSTEDRFTINMFRYGLPSALQKYTQEELNRMIIKETCDNTSSASTELFEMMEAKENPHPFFPKTTHHKPANFTVIEVSRDYLKGNSLDDFSGAIGNAIKQLYGDDDNQRNKGNRKKPVFRWINKTHKVKSSLGSIRFDIKLYDKIYAWRVEIEVKNPRIKRNEDREAFDTRLYEEELYKVYLAAVEVLDDIHDELQIPRPIVNKTLLLEVLKKCKVNTNPYQIRACTSDLSLSAIYDHNKASKEGRGVDPTVRKNLKDWGFWESKKRGVYLLCHEFDQAPKNKENLEQKKPKSVFYRGKDDLDVIAKAFLNLIIKSGPLDLSDSQKEDLEWHNAFKKFSSRRGWGNDPDLVKALRESKIA